MTSATSAGRRIGVLLLLQMATGLILSFVLMDAVRVGYPAFLETAAASAPTVKAGIAVSFLGAGLTAAIGISMYQFLAGFNQRMGLAVAAVCVISAALDLVHGATVLSMVSAAQQYAAAAGGDTALYQAWGIAAASMRRSVHIAQLVGIGGWIFVLYFSLLRYRMIPRPLAALGVVGILSQFVGVTLMMFLGFSPITYLAMPLAPIHAIAAIWLILRGLGGTAGLSRSANT